MHNNINKSNRKLATVNDKKVAFRVRIKDIPGKKADYIEYLLKRGFRKKYRSLYCTDKIDSEEELYKKIGEVEEAIYKGFRYDPLKDFSQTWYVLVYEKMLGKISHEEAKEYQRDYFIRTYPDIAKYFGLLWD